MVRLDLVTEDWDAHADRFGFNLDAKDAVWIEDVPAFNRESLVDCYLMLLNGGDKPSTHYKERYKLMERLSEVRFGKVCKTPDEFHALMKVEAVSRNYTRFFVYGGGFDGHVRGSLAYSMAVAARDGVPYKQALEQWRSDQQANPRYSHGVDCFPEAAWWFHQRFSEQPELNPVTRHP